MDAGRTLRHVRSAEIRTLFGYLYWIRDRVLIAARDAGLSAELRVKLVHELDVELGWRSRLTGAQERDLDPADFATLDTLAAHWQRDEVEMRAWLETLTDQALAAPPVLEKDQSFPLWYYLLHVVSHGIQELEEAVVVLEASGHSPRNLGFLDYADTVRVRSTRCRRSRRR